MYAFGPTPIANDVPFRIGKFDGENTALDNIIKYGESLEKEQGRVGFDTSDVRPECRISDVSWIRPGPRTYWIYEKLTTIIQDANSKWFNYDLSGFHDAMQYTVYEGEKKAHFGWHTDNGDKYEGPQRKLSVSLLLSDPSEYEGGDFQLLYGANHTDMPFKDRGTVIIFPSYTLHRVTPVTKGVRRALVAWVCGPKLR